MSLSKRAKRGIAIFNKIQTSPNRLRYAMRKLTIERPQLAANILHAAQAAAEAINASVHALPNQENSPVTVAAEAGPERSVSGEPQNSPEAEKGTPGGAQ